MKRREWLRLSFQWSTAVVLASHGARRWGFGGQEAQARELWDADPHVERTLRPGRWPILQGATSADATQFSIMFKKDEPVAAELVDALTGDAQLPFSMQVESRDYSPWAVLKLTYRGLPAGRTWRLRVGGTDEREVTLPAADRTRLRVGVISCVQDTGDAVKQRVAWLGFLAQKPEALVLIGDHVYVDQGKNIPNEPWAERIWRRYAESRLFHEFYYASKLVPTYATWDDHDFGKNNASGPDVDWADEAPRVFEAFFAQAEAPGIVRGPGIATAMDLGGVRWVLADDRTWRGGPSAAGATHWGDAQEQWIDQQIDSAPGTTVVCNGSQFFGGYLPGESYEKSQPASFAAFRARLGARRNRVFFISGDRHFSELMRVSTADVGYETFELTTSGFLNISHLSIPWPFFRNPRRLAGTSESQNYALLELETLTDRAMSGAIASVSNKGHVIFNREFKI